MSLSAALAIVNPIAAPLLASGPAPFAPVGTLGNAQVRLRARLRADPRRVDRGLYLIVAADGQSFYHGKGDGLTARLGQHRGCAERLGYRPHAHAVAVWFAPSASTDLRGLERRINAQLLARNAGLPRGSGLRATNKNQELSAADALGAAGVFATFTRESTMHAMTCSCPRCREAGAIDVLEFEDSAAFEGLSALQHGAAAMAEDREVELALELLSVSSEQELDQFLGKLVRGAWKGLKTAGAAVGKIAKPLGGVLRTVAKTALPFVGGALGSFIPIPGVGTVLGRAVGQAVSSALEAETAGLDPGSREFEMARRFVRIADTAARQAVTAAARGAEPSAAVQQAVAAATRQHLPGMAGATSGQRPAPAAGPGGRPPRRWVRRGGTIVVHGV